MKACDPSLFLTPPAIAKRLRVKPSKVIAWIKRDELVAIDVSENRGRRPRWRIAPEELQRFLESRSSRHPARAARRRKPVAAVLEFFA
jgi:transposase